jgi:hypothetical protein
MRSAYKLRMNMQRIFDRSSAHFAHAVCNRMQCEKRRNCVAQGAYAGAELSGHEVDDHEDAPERYRAILTFFNFYFPDR